MRVLQINKYHIVRGGADRVYFETTRLLEERGNEVASFSTLDPANQATPYASYFADNLDWTAVGRVSPVQRVRAVGRVLYDLSARQRLAALLQQFRPDVAHLHNLHYQLSPAILHTLRVAGVPVVMTLHDYRLICPNGYLYNNVVGICRACQGHHYWNAVRYRCLRDSRLGSALAAIATTWYAALGLWRLVDIFITPSQFLRQVMLSAGIASDERIVQIFNCVDSAVHKPANTPGSYLLLYGYLVPQKGVITFLQALTHFPSLPVRIAGEGPMEEPMQAFIKKHVLRHVELVGFLQGEPLHNLVRGAMFTVVPSQWYENSPMTIYESYVFGRPVLAAHIGGIPELVDEGQTGLLFRSGDADDLADKLGQMLGRQDELLEWGRRGREKLERELGSDRYYRQLMEVYERAIAVHGTVA